MDESLQGNLEGITDTQAESLKELGVIDETGYEVLTEILENCKERDRVICVIENGKLVTLDISEQELGTLSVDLDHAFPDLRELNAHKNNLSNLPSWGDFKNLRRVTLYGNPRFYDGSTGDLKPFVASSVRILESKGCNVVRSEY